MAALLAKQRAELADILVQSYGMASAGGHSAVGRGRKGWIGLPQRWPGRESSEW